MRVSMCGCTLRLPLPLLVFQLSIIVPRPRALVLLLQIAGDEIRAGKSIQVFLPNDEILFEQRDGSTPRSNIPVAEGVRNIARCTGARRQDKLFILVKEYGYTAAPSTAGVLDIVYPERYADSSRKN